MSFRIIDNTSVARAREQAQHAQQNAVPQAADPLGVFQSGSNNEKLKTLLSNLESKNPTSSTEKKPRFVQQYSVPQDYRLTNPDEL